MSIVVENEKMSFNINSSQELEIIFQVFEHFGELFPEIRKVMVDEMQPVGRCRFTRYLKLSQKEAKKSKNYIYGLSFTVDYARVKISVKFDKYCYGFKLNFGENYKQCVNRGDQELWRIELDSSTDVIQHGAEEFKSLLQLYQNTIQWLSLKGSRKFPKNYDFGIKSLKNLTKLEIWCDFNVSQVFSKLRQPLNKLLIYGETSFQKMADFEEELYQVPNKITLYGVKLNYEKLTRLSAKCIELDIASLTEMDIFKLIRSWQNSTDWKKINRYDLLGVGSHLYFSRLMDLLGITGFDAQNVRDVQYFYIKHFKDNQKTSKLRYNFLGVALILKKIVSR